jgi:hypothetical protein
MKEFPKNNWSNKKKIVNKPFNKKNPKLKNRKKN